MYPLHPNLDEFLKSIQSSDFGTGAKIRHSSENDEFVNLLQDGKNGTDAKITISSQNPELAQSVDLLSSNLGPVNYQ